MLSFVKGKPIAQIQGGERDGELLGIVDKIGGCEENKDCKCDERDSLEDDEYITYDDYEEDPIEALDKDFLSQKLKKKQGYALPEARKENIRNALKKRRLPRDQDQDTLDVYYEAKGKLKSQPFTEFKINNGSVQQIPKTDGRDSLYIAGPSGSGKSTYAGNYAKQYRILFPNNPIYIFSDVEEDKSLDKLKPKRIKIDKELLEDPINPEELKNSLVIFDDIDSIEDKALFNYVHYLRDKLLKVGRHENISVITTNHLLTDNKRTKILLNEAKSITFFPNSGSGVQMHRLLNAYCGISPKQIKRIQKLPSRWVTLLKDYPQCILYEKGGIMLNSLKE